MIDFLGVSENVAYRTRKWLRVNDENDENPMDLGLHYFQETQMLVTWYLVVNCG